MIHSLRHVFLACAAAALLAGTSSRCGAADLESQTQLFRLANGMTWIVAPMAGTDEATVLFYLARGSAQEGAGRRGATSLLTALWRQNTAAAIAAGGGRPAAFYGNPDFAVARITWPADRLGDGIKLAAIQLMSPDLAGFSAARQAAITERDRVLARGRGLFAALLPAAYPAHPYGQPHHGAPGDLERLTADDLAAHLHTQLVASNVIVVVTGAVDPALLRPLAETAFGAFPRAEALPLPKVVEPAQQAEKRVTLPNSALTGFAIGYHKGPGADASIAAWDVLADLWKQRLQARLGPQMDQITRLDISQGPAMRDPNLLFLFCLAKPGTDLAPVEAAALAEAEQLATVPVTPEELQQARDRLVGGPDTPNPREIGQHLADWQAMAGDWHNKFRYRERVRQVTATQVLALARTTLSPTNRTVVTSR